MSNDRLMARRARIDTYQQPVVYLRSDCPVCRAEGFEAQAQVELICGARHLLAILNHVSGEWLHTHEVALSDVAWSTALPAHSVMSDASWMSGTRPWLTSSIRLRSAS